jgi:hypothetical protein
VEKQVSTATTLPNTMGAMTSFMVAFVVSAMVPAVSSLNLLAAGGEAVIYLRDKMLRLPAGKSRAQLAASRDDYESRFKRRLFELLPLRLGT